MFKAESQFSRRTAPATAHGRRAARSFAVGRGHAPTAQRSQYSESQSTESDASHHTNVKRKLGELRYGPIGKCYVAYKDLDFCKEGE